MHRHSALRNFFFVVTMITFSPSASAADIGVGTTLTFKKSVVFQSDNLVEAYFANGKQISNPSKEKKFCKLTFERGRKGDRIELTPQQTTVDFVRETRELATIAVGEKHHLQLRCFESNVEVNLDASTVRAAFGGLVELDPKPLPPRVRHFKMNYEQPTPPTAGQARGA